MEAVNIGVFKPPKPPISVLSRRILDAPALELPIDIAPGESRTFEIYYMIGREGEPLPEGNFTVLFKVLAYPRVGSYYNERVRFVAKKTCPGG